MKEFFRIKNQQPFLSRKQATVLCFVALFFGVVFWATPTISHAWSLTEAINGIINGVLGSIVWLLGKILTLLMAFLIWIAGYNNIIYQPAVIKGWLVMRDVLNVGFIIFMMIIAFGTIFNVERYSYKSMLAKVLLAAILVNFSKTLVGLAIDMAHVFTMMFFNAYKTAGAGNMTEALGLYEMLKFSDPGGGDSLNILGAYLLAIIMLIIAIVTILVYLLVFVTRIIVLWFLTITSPVFFVMRAVPFGEKYASQWMTEFGKYVPMGPILAFFLWLSFAIMGTSHNTFDTVLESAGGNNVTGDLSAGVSSVGSPVNMLSFIVSIGVLWMALKYAGQTSGIAGKFAGTMMGKLQGVGGKIGGKILKSPWTLTKGLAYKAGMNEKVKKVLDKAGTVPILGGLVRPGMKQLGAKKKKYATKGTEEVSQLEAYGADQTIREQMMKHFKGNKFTRSLRRPSSAARYKAAMTKQYHTLEGEDAIDFANHVSDEDIKNSSPAQVHAVTNRLNDVIQTGQGKDRKGNIVNIDPATALKGLTKMQSVIQASGANNTVKYSANLDKDGTEIYTRDAQGKYQDDPQDTTKYLRKQGMKDDDVRAVENVNREIEKSSTFKESGAPSQKKFVMFRADDNTREEGATEGEQKAEGQAERGGERGIGENVEQVTIAAQNVTVQDQGKQRLEIGAQEFVHQMQEKDAIESQINSAQQEVEQATQQQHDLLDRGEGGEALMKAQDAQRRAQDTIQKSQDRSKNIEPALRIDKQKWGIPKNQDSLSKDEIAKFLPDLLKQAQGQGVVGPQLQAFENYLKTAQTVPIEDTRKAQDKVGGVDAVIKQQKMGLETKNPKLYLDKTVLGAAGMAGVAGGTVQPKNSTPEDKQTFEKLLNALDKKMTSQGYSEAERTMARQGLEGSETIRFVNTDAKRHQGEGGELEQYRTGLEEKMHSFVGQMPEEKMMQFWNALGDEKDAVKKTLTEEYQGLYGKKGEEPDEAVLANEYLAKSLVNATRFGNKDDTTSQLNDEMKTMIEQSHDSSMQFMKSVLKSGTLPPPVPAKQQSAFRYNVDSEQIDQEVSGGEQKQSAQEQPQGAQGSPEVIDALREVGEHVQEGAQQVSATVSQTVAKAMKQEKKEGQETRKQAGDIAKQQAWVQKNTARRMQTAMKKNQEQILQQGAQTGEQVQNVGEQVGTVADNQNTQSIQPSSSEETSNTQEATSPAIPQTTDQQPSQPPQDNV
ncbi:MAG TPA: hypothetical protein VJB93_03045 [Patescibacteria group bacterium]|nr:hypothetical protein [Patescibacteria group bacterium]